MADVRPFVLAMTVRELKTLIEGRLGASAAGCVEKSDLVDLVLQRTEALHLSIHDLRHTSPESGGAAAAATTSAACPAAAHGPREGTYFDIDQEGPEWHFMRRGAKGLGQGGSEVWKSLAVDGGSPREFMRELIQKAIGTWVPEQYSEAPDDDAVSPMAHGTECEPLIAKMYAFYEKAELAKGGFYTHWDARFSDLYGASPDGRVMDKTTNKVMRLLEIKAPFSRMYLDVKPSHMAQMQYQMGVSGVAECDYCAVFLDKHKPEATIPSKTQVLLVRVPRSEAYQMWMWPRLFLFSKLLMNALSAAREAFKADLSGKEAEAAAMLHLPPLLLYSNEANGLEPAPHVFTETIHVQTGDWSVREAMTGKRSRPAFRTPTLASGVSS